MNKLYFIARTDVGAGSGEQRVFGAFDSEEEAAAFGVQIAAQRPGDYAVFEGNAVLNLIKAASPRPFREVLLCVQQHDHHRRDKPKASQRLQVFD
jgi:hypothetical protein